MSVIVDDGVLRVGDRMLMDVRLIEILKGERNIPVRVYDIQRNGSIKTLVLMRDEAVH